MTASSSAGLVVVAAGVGRRLGGAVHKALVDVTGTPLVEHTLRRLLRDPALDPVVVVGHPDDLETLRRIVASLDRPVTVVPGGARRQDSVAAGLAVLPPRVDVVLVHDAARPFVPLEPLPELVEEARRHGCAILAVPVADTVKAASRADPRSAERTVPREALWAAQTPQAFRRKDLERLLEEAEGAGRTVTDEAGLFEVSGLTVRFVEGSRLNFKVTTAEDLRLARAVMAVPRENGGPWR